VTTTDPRPDDTALRDIAHGVLDANRYLVLGTIEQDGRPRVSPVYFTHDDYRRLYWVSSPASTHSGQRGGGQQGRAGRLRLVEAAEGVGGGLSHPVWGSGIDRRVTVQIG
jgi:hypothetical protein